MLIPGEKCRHFIPGKKFQGKNVDIFSHRTENSIPRNGEIVFLEKRARHHLKFYVIDVESLDRACLCQRNVGPFGSLRRKTKQDK